MKMIRSAVAACLAAGFTMPAHAQSLPDFHCPPGSQVVEVSGEKSKAPKGSVVVARQAHYAKGMPVRMCVAPKGSPLAAANHTPMIVLGTIAAVGAVALVAAAGSRDDAPVSR